MKKIITRFVLTILISVLTVGSVSPLAHATSSYDAVYEPGEAIIKCYGDGSEVDVSTSYISKIWPTGDLSSNDWGQAFLADLTYGSGWALVQHVNSASGDKSLMLYVTPDPASAYATFETNTDYPNGYIRVNGSPTYALDLNCSNPTYFVRGVNGIAYNRALAFTDYRWSPGYEGHPIYINMPITYPSGYAGATVPSGVIDTDGDGLNSIQEQAQGTSDSNPDSDNDGVGYYKTSSDYTESVWNTNRDTEFCDTSTPKNCAYPDPTKKDLYLQIDWLNNGTTAYKPTSTQLALVTSKFSDLGIKFHVDTDQYGGGNEISSNEAPTTLPTLSTRGDFYSHKYGDGVSELPNFDVTNRYKIWHYMLSGYNYDANTSSSGMAEPGGDDSFLSYGLLKDNFGSGASFDNAVAGTIVHELGHNLCLSNTSYFGQDSSCLFNGIDNNFASVNYHSAMNYTYQFQNIYSYSNGISGVGDHDDITALPFGFNDFQGDDDSSVGGI